MGDTLIPKFMFLVADKGANVCFVFLLITTASRTTSRAQILLFSNWALHLGFKKILEWFRPGNHPHTEPNISKATAGRYATS